MSAAANSSSAAAAQPSVVSPLYLDCSSSSPLSLAWSPASSALHDRAASLSRQSTGYIAGSTGAAGAAPLRRCPNHDSASAMAAYAGEPRVPMHQTLRRGEPPFGPGRAARAPRGTPYRVGGAVLRHTITYDSFGNALLQLTAEAVVPTSGFGGVSPSPSAAQSMSAATPRELSASGEPPMSASPMGARPPAAVAVGPSPSPFAAAAARQQQQGGASPAAQSILGSLGVYGSAGAVITPRSGQRRSEADRAVARERETFVARVTIAYPLLRVLPLGETLREQLYCATTTAAAPTTPAADPQSLSSFMYNAPTQAPWHRSAERDDSAGASVSSSLQVSGDAALSSGEGPLSTPLQTHNTSAFTFAPATQPAVSSSTAAFSIRLGSSVDDAGSLRALAWGGCRPAVLRAAAWRLLSGYAPPSLPRQAAELRRKRQQYSGYARQYVDIAAVDAYLLSHDTDDGKRSGGGGAGEGGGGGGGRRNAERLTAYGAITMGGAGRPGEGGRGPAASAPTAPSAGLSHLAPHERAILSQLALDLPRHSAAVFHCDRTIAAMARGLFLWGQRHPAVGYVQGMDDVFAVFFQLFLGDALGQHERACQGAAGADDAALAGLLTGRHAAAVGGHHLATWDAATLDAALDRLPAGCLAQVEADAFWCAGRILAVLQDNFTHGQPGLVRGGAQLEAVVARADPALSSYFDEHGIALRGSCFQWLHCMLTRELPLPMCLVLWDTYLAVGEAELNSFHIYVCAALVLCLRPLVTQSAPMDVAMMALKNPFPFLFPKGRPVDAAAGDDDGISKSEREWLAMLIADAYRLWKQFPL